MEITKEKAHHLVLGAGSIGARVARLLALEGYRVTATTSNAQTKRALELCGVQVLEWVWSPGQSWDTITTLGATHWCVTVPPRLGHSTSVQFHQELQTAARAAHVKRLLWTSSTAVYDSAQSGTIVEGDAIHRQSKHTGVDLFELELLHSKTDAFDPEFVAMRFGGLFSEARHPASAMTKRTPVRQADGTVQWVHESDAAAACAHVICLPDLPCAAFNVVAPVVLSRRELLKPVYGRSGSVGMESDGVSREVSSEALRATGFDFNVPNPLKWICDHPVPTSFVRWEGPNGPLNATFHHPTSEPVGTMLMVHGYKGFRSWGGWGELADCWAQHGWRIVRMDFSHNGHIEPFNEECLDEDAWSRNHHHFEVEEVEFALNQLAGETSDDCPLVVFGHSRGGAAALLGAQRFEMPERHLGGVVLWSTISDLLARMPRGASLQKWEQEDRLEVVNARTGQVLMHPFRFYEETLKRQDELDMSVAAASLRCHLLCVHGTEDWAVDAEEGRRVASWHPRGTMVEISGADHVFGMRHPWLRGQEWPDPLREAWESTLNWMNQVQSETGG